MFKTIEKFLMDTIKLNPRISHISMAYTHDYKHSFGSHYIIFKSGVCEAFGTAEELSDYIERHNILMRRF